MLPSPARRALFCAITTTVVLSVSPALSQAADFPLGDRVDTRVGTDEGAADFNTGGGAGATYPGPTAPFGMVQLSPDTIPSIRNSAGGYTFRDKSLRGFSMTHISGAGCPGLGDLPLLPVARPVTSTPAVKDSFDIARRYAQRFSHRGEVARPGDYRVALGDGSRVETTATARTGLMRIKFPAKRRSSLIVNAGGSQMGNELVDLRVDRRRREISGEVSSGWFCLAPGRYRLFMVARFDRRPAETGTWTETAVRRGARRVREVAGGRQNRDAPLQIRRMGTLQGPKGNPTTGALAGAYASFDTRRSRTVTVRVGLSTTSVAGARRNLESEAPRKRSFSAVRLRARDVWERQLGAVDARGGAAADRRTLTGMLYRSLLMPNTASDVDGRYRGMDDRVRRRSKGTHYATFSGWDVYRSQIPLVAALRPDVAADLATSLVADERASGAMPKWSVFQGQTGTMVGDPADLAIAQAHAFGARGFDSRAALAAMVRGATVPKKIKNGDYVQRPGLADVLAAGYVGFEQNTDNIGAWVDQNRPWGTAATTLEYASADFAIARLAAAIGDSATCTAFAPRAAAWRHLLDPVTKRLRPRNAGGTQDSAPDLGPASEVGYVEGSEEQYTWSVPHDVGGLVDALGGPGEVIPRLDRFFTELNAGPRSDHAFLGNEPTLHTPYLYAWLGAPERGAAIVRRAMLSLYRATPGGYPGNDDGGQMASWWVWNAIGLYPAVHGEDALVFGAPLFPRVDVRAPGGTVTIRAPRAARGTTAIRGVRLRGAPLDRTWLRWSDIRRGATLDVSLARTPGSWGRSPDAAPPSFGTPGRLCAR